MDMDNLFDESVEAWGDDPDSNSNDPSVMIQSLDPSSIYQFESVKSEPMTTSDLTCLYCQANFDNEDLLEEHLEDCPNTINVAEELERNIGSSDYDKSDDFNLLNSSNNSNDNINALTFGCHICGKKFRFQSQLTRHIKTHTGDRPHSCETCGATFASRWHLSRHKMTHFAQQKIFFCDLCLTAFAKKKNYEFHMKSHAKDKPYKCGECRTCFKLKDELGFHMQMHTGRNTPTVNSTPPPAVVKSAHNPPPPLPKLVPLPISIQVPHKKPDLKPSISITPIHSDSKTSNNYKNNNYNIPISIVSKFSSSNGPTRKLSDMPKLVPHVPVVVMRSRSRRKPPRKILACEVCGHTFSRNHHLQRHKLTHTGERPFSCDHCDKSFSRKERLNAHVLKDHIVPQRLQSIIISQATGQGAISDEIVGL